MRPEWGRTTQPGQGAQAPHAQHRLPHHIASTIGPRVSCTPEGAPQMGPSPLEGKMDQNGENWPMAVSSWPSVHSGCPPAGWGWPCRLHGVPSTCHPSRGHPAATTLPQVSPGLQACGRGPGDSIGAHCQASGELWGRLRSCGAHCGPPATAQLSQRVPGRRKVSLLRSGPKSPRGPRGAAVSPFLQPTTKPFFREGLLGSPRPAASVTLGQEAPSPG